MTLLNVSATLVIVTTTISSMAEVCTRCPRAGVGWISRRRQQTAFSLCYGYHSCSLLLIPALPFWAIFTHLSGVFPHQTDSGNPTTTISVGNVHSVGSASEVDIFLRPISSATSTPGTSESQTHLLTVNHIAQTWCARTLVPGRPWIKYLLPGTQSSIDWQTSWAFSSLITSWWHSSPISFLIMWRTALNSALVLSESRTSLPSTCSWTSLAPWSVFIWSSINSLSCCEVSWADRLILLCSWYSLRS